MYLATLFSQNTASVARLLEYRLGTYVPDHHVGIRQVSIAVSHILRWNGTSHGKPNTAIQNQYHPPLRHLN